MCVWWANGKHPLGVSTSFEIARGDGSTILLLLKKEKKKEKAFVVGVHFPVFLITEYL